MESQYIKLVLVGDSGVGKTQIVNTYCFGLKPQANRDYTIGCDYVMKRALINGNYVKLQIWDVAGSEINSSLMRIYMRGALGVLFVCDGESEQSKSHLVQWRNQVAQYADEYNGRHIPSLVVMNKMDLQNEYQNNTLQQLQLFATQNGFADAIQVSAYSNLGISEAFDTIVDEIFRRDLITMQMRRNASRINKLQIYDPKMTMKSQSKCT